MKNKNFIKAIGIAVTDRIWSKYSYRLGKRKENG